MIDQPTPGSTGDAGDAGQQNDTGDLQVHYFTDDRAAFRFNGQWRPVFAGGDGTDDGGDGGDGSGNDNPDAGAPGDKDTFTKDDVERIIQARLAAERKKHGDIDALKTKAAEYDKLEESKKSEVEKANERAATAEKEKADNEAELRKERTSNAVTLAASALGFVDPSDAHRLLDTADLEFGDDGRPTKESLNKLLKALAESKPYLVGKAKPRGDGGGGPRGDASGGEPTMSDRIRALARIRVST